MDGSARPLLWRPGNMRLDDLRELARLCSVQLSYEDAAGKTRTASREALQAVLSARFPGYATLDEALRARRDEIARRVVEPVTVAWGSEVPLLELRVPAADQDGRATCEITLESGEHVSGILHLGALHGEWSEEGHVGKTATLPSLPIGYHTLRLTLGGTTYESAIFVAPQRAHAPEGRSWGIFAPVYAMRTVQTRGIGDLGDLQAYRAWVNELGGGIVATLPMNAIFPDDDPSPYSPVSRLYWNELYLDVRALPEWQGEELPAHEGLQIDWKRVATERHAVLSKMAERFVPDGEYERFAEEARDYARFMGDVRYHLYVQYRMAQQMRALAADARRGGLGLYLDFPLGVNPNGYDAHRYAEHFAKGVSVGAPPDLFFTKGQNWGFPPFDPDAVRERHHSYFRDCIRHQLAHAGVLRIDHVMGLHRLFWIPSGGEAKDGLYVRYPDEELYAILTIESSRSRSAIVGEDLGTVPQYVPRMMSRHGIRRMYVVQYEIQPEGDEPAGAPAEESIASINTHDADVRGVLGRRGRRRPPAAGAARRERSGRGAREACEDARGADEVPHGARLASRRREPPGCGSRSGPPVSRVQRRRDGPRQSRGSLARARAGEPPRRRGPKLASADAKDARRGARVRRGRAAARCRERHAKDG